MNEILQRPCWRCHSQIGFPSVPSRMLWSSSCLSLVGAMIYLTSLKVLLCSPRCLRVIPTAGSVAPAGIAATRTRLCHWRVPSGRISTMSDVSHPMCHSWGSAASFWVSPAVISMECDFKDATPWEWRWKGSGCCSLSSLEVLLKEAPAPSCVVVFHWDLSLELVV